MRNKELIITNLEEAIEQLQESVEELRKNEDFSEPELRIDLEHAYHHLNYGWHVRDASDKDLDEDHDKNYVKWSKYPVGEILEYE